ncbi:MAG: 4-alpha-glucanotransferase [Alphaproteobacteria bacterium]|uniref:4-alpha-glucanotransferase n=1 Tax=Candidatus Nitrobium versatile TaxID=2884831 RepID=A0A953J6B1_9BACT|nr:4-alpha-glucanotransferase [Candidatus Nitrobium versatile]
MTMFFGALYRRFARKQLSEWSVEIRRRRPDAVRDAQDTLREECERERFLQYLFHRQWFALKEYSNAGGVQIIGDIPLYVNCTSSDVCAHPGIFKVDEDLAPLGKGGGAPPIFSVRRVSSSKAPYTGGMLYSATGTAGGYGV